MCIRDRDKKEPRFPLWKPGLAIILESVRKQRSREIAVAGVGEQNDDCLLYTSCPYKSPTDMGVNMAGFAICDDDACREASYQEIIRRYLASACAVKKGVAMPEELRKQEMLKIGRAHV